jgi:single-stranded DNA-specific DHH superfamily exonuclease
MVGCCHFDADGLAAGALVGRVLLRPGFSLETYVVSA